MWSSATASSSLVLTPGRTAARTARSAPAVTRPEARISSISRAVLIWIIRPLHFASRGSRARRAAPRSPCTSCLAASGLGRAVVPAECPQRPVGDLVDAADRVDLAQQSGSLVDPRQRRRLFPVDLQAAPHRLGLVVVALHPLAVDEHAPAGEPAHQLLLLDDQLEHPVEGVPHLGQ